MSARPGWAWCSFCGDVPVIMRRSEFEGVTYEQPKCPRCDVALGLAEPVEPSKI